VGVDVVEVNPILDIQNATGRLAVQLALSALGKRIWYAAEPSQDVLEQRFSGRGA
jgi:arginase